MLVLSRRPQERIVFPKLGIEVEILGVSGNTVRVGVNAPREVLVLRHEVAEKDAARAAGRPAATPPAEIRSESPSQAMANDRTPPTPATPAAATPAAATPAAATPAAATPAAATPAAATSAAPVEAISATRKWIHQLRNYLNTAGLAMQVAQSQMACGDTNDADAKLQLAMAQLQALEATLSVGPPSDPAAIPAAANRAIRPTDLFGPPSEPAPADVSAAKTQQLSTLSRKPLALVVEDNAEESAMLADILRLNGFRVDTASDGCHALDYLASHKQQPDVVLLDMRMPRCDGPTTISKIRSNPQLSGLRVVAVSGYRSSELGVGTGPQGVDRWFCKPVDTTRLVHELKHDLHVTTGAPRPESRNSR